jgi:GH25 family lysozyme M1 (1,4-beta-N-acetylmuramidase)
MSITPRERTYLHAAVVLLAVAAALIATGVIGVHGISSGQSAQQTKRTAEHATILSQTVPNPDCFPPVGAGHLGSCAPVQAMGAANALGKAAGDPNNITGHPLGVDVSSYQGCSINWSREPVQFAIFKATESTGYTDACLAHNIAGAKAGRLAYSEYDFLRPGSTSPVAEADHFAAAVNSAGGNTSLPPVADVEVNAGLSPTQLHSYVCAWEGRVKQLLHRTTVITYTGFWFWQPQVAGDSCGSILWDSAYASFAVTPSSWSHTGGITLWQYSDGIYGPTPHISGWDSDVLLKGTLAGLGAKAVIAVPAKKVPTKKVLKKLRVKLRILLTKHRCRVAPKHGGGRYHAPCTHWLAEGKRVNRELRAERTRRKGSA